MTDNLARRYKPEFTQLPYGFVNTHSGLQKLIRTTGPNVLAVYIVIQDKMAGRSDDNFTLSRNELIDDIRETLHLHDLSDDEVFGLIKPLIEANILDERVIPDRYTDTEECRYCIAPVCEALEDARDAWISKCINPTKSSKEEKAAFKELQAKVNACRKEIRNLVATKKRHNILMKQEHDLRDEGNSQIAEVHRLAIEDCDKQMASWYRKIHTIENEMDNIKMGGDDTNE